MALSVSLNMKTEQNKTMHTPTLADLSNEILCEGILQSSLRHSPMVPHIEELCARLRNHEALVEALKLILEAHDDIGKDFDSAIKQGRAVLAAVEGEA